MGIRKTNVIRFVTGGKSVRGKDWHMSHLHRRAGLCRRFQGGGTCGGEQVSPQNILDGRRNSMVLRWEDKKYFE